MVSWLTLVSLDSPVGGWVGLGLGGLGLRTGVSVTETGNWLLGRQTSDGQEAARCFYQLLPRTGCQSCGSLVRRGRQKQDNPDRDKLGQKYTIVQFKSRTIWKGKQNHIVPDILLCTVSSIASLIVDVDVRELSWDLIFRNFHMLRLVYPEGEICLFICKSSPPPRAERRLRV